MNTLICFYRFIQYKSSYDAYISKFCSPNPPSIAMYCPQGDDVILDELNIEVQIYSQYVSVSIDAVVFNPHDGVQLADFNLRLPEQAFISYFHM